MPPLLNRYSSSFHSALYVHNLQITLRWSKSDGKLCQGTKKVCLWLKAIKNGKRKEGKASYTRTQHDIPIKFIKLSVWKKKKTGKSFPWLTGQLTASDFIFQLKALSELIWYVIRESEEKEEEGKKLWKSKKVSECPKLLSDITMKTIASHFWITID